MALSDDGTPSPARKPEYELANGHVTPLSLLERARANDAEAWRTLLRLYRPLVCYWCRRGGVADADIEDLTQDVFTAVALGLAKFRRDRPGDTFRGWVCGIARNQTLMHFRRTANKAQGEGGSHAWEQLQKVVGPADLHDAEERAEIRQVYRRALELVRGDFEERTWHAFWLTVIEGRAPATLTEELGLSLAGVRQAKARVLRRLRQELGDVLE
jgi:RNA polymerase sigma-70 factor (ECF subfamily)